MEGDARFRRSIKGGRDRARRETVGPGGDQHAHDAQPRRLRQGGEPVQGLFFVHVIDSSTIVEMMCHGRSRGASPGEDAHDRTMRT